jgi:hypothetical protein
MLTRLTRTDWGTDSAGSRTLREGRSRVQPELGEEAMAGAVGFEPTIS